MHMGSWGAIPRDADDVDPPSLGCDALATPNGDVPATLGNDSPVPPLDNAMATPDEEATANLGGDTSHAMGPNDPLR